MTENDKAWEGVFNDYPVMTSICSTGYFRISANQMKPYREPRLMAKFDHWNTLPAVFKENKLSILPISRGEYLVSRVKNYHKFETPGDERIRQFSLPHHLKSLSIDRLNSEALALNAAVAAGIISDFLEDDRLVPTVSGRMGSGRFTFDALRHEGDVLPIRVQDAQIEIDAAYEGSQGLAIIEAKNKLSEDFLIRQLYYPFRTWQEKLATKPVRSIFLTYSNYIYSLYEYVFNKTHCYNSILLVKQARYSIIGSAITKNNIWDVLTQTQVKPEPQNIPFPQADSFSRIINLCEMMQANYLEKAADLDKAFITQEYDFTERQADYYVNAGRYLGLLDSASCRLSRKGAEVLDMPSRQRQLQYCASMFSHAVFNDAMRSYFRCGRLPEHAAIVQIMLDNRLGYVLSSNTIHRRAKTVYSWLQWVVGLVSPC